MKLRAKHWEIGRHYERFVDRRWFPDYKLDEQSLYWFVRIDSHGTAGIPEHGRFLAKPLLNGKAQRELTLKLLFDEMAEWWSGGNGWFYPIAHTIRTEMWEHGRSARDRVYIRALVKIMRSCRCDGFLPTLMAFTGMSKDDKARYAGMWLSMSET